MKWANVGQNGWKIEVGVLTVQVRFGGDGRWQWWIDEWIDDGAKEQTVSSGYAPDEYEAKWRAKAALKHIEALRTLEELPWTDWK